MCFSAIYSCRKHKYSSMSGDRTLPADRSASHRVGEEKEISLARKLRMTARITKKQRNLLLKLNEVASK